MPWVELERHIAGALHAIERSGDLFWVANRGGSAGADDVAVHQARVAVLSMRLGITMGLGRAQVLLLGMAGALMDIGLWRLPTALLRAPHTLDATEQSLYRTHPRLAVDLIGQGAVPFEGLAEIVLHHHEREHGQGFPEGLSGAAIHPHAKILGLVDVYAGLTRASAAGSGLPPHEAVRDILRARHDAFPPACIKALLTEISMFPPGTLVRLNTGEVGCVVAINRNHPLRPRVEIYDARGRRQRTPKIIDLAEAPFVYIASPAGDEGR